MASTGQISLHFPQAVHFSDITYAIIHRSFHLIIRCSHLENNIFSTSDSQAGGETFRKAGLADFSLRGGYIIFNPSQLNFLSFQVIDRI